MAGIEPRLPGQQAIAFVHASIAFQAFLITGSSPLMLDRYLDECCGRDSSPDHVLLPLLLLHLQRKPRSEDTLETNGCQTIARVFLECAHIDRCSKFFKTIESSCAPTAASGFAEERLH